MNQVERLIKRLSNEDPDVRTSAAETLGQIGATRAIEPLIELLNDEDPDVRYTAAEALGQIGKPAVKPLILSLFSLWDYDDEEFEESLWDDDEEFLKSVSEVLDTIDPDWATKRTARRHLRSFSELLKKGDMPVRLYIIGVLEKIGDKIPGVSELLTIALEDQDRGVQLRAAKALEKIKAIGNI